MLQNTHRSFTTRNEFFSGRACIVVPERDWAHCRLMFGEQVVHPLKHKSTPPAPGRRLLLSLLDLDQSLWALLLPEHRTMDGVNRCPDKNLQSKEWCYHHHRLHYKKLYSCSLQIVLNVPPLLLFVGILWISATNKALKDTSSRACCAVLDAYCNLLLRNVSRGSTWQMLIECYWT